MLSTFLELAGFASLIAATFLLGGLIAALYSGGAVLLLIGYATDDAKAAVSVARAVAPVRRVPGRVRARLTERRQRRLAKAA